jgi:hypothetical protein
MASADKCNLSVVPPQPVPAKNRIVPEISQDQLRWIVHCDNEVFKLRQFEAQLRQARAEVQVLLESGAGIQPGPWAVYLETVTTNHPNFQKPIPVRPGVVRLPAPTLTTRVVVERGDE